MNKTITLCFLFLSLTSFCQNIEEEKIGNWVFPEKNNFISLKSKENSDNFFRINYFKISEQLMGSTLEIGFMNSDPSAKLFEIGNDQISLIKTKDGASLDTGGEEHDWGKNNIYFKLPDAIGVTKWSYADDDGTIYYGFSHWKEGKEKNLVIERQISGNQKSSEKVVEYYSKNKGLIKKEIVNVKSKNLVEAYTTEESGFDNQMNINDFPLFYAIESKDKNKSFETNEQTNNTEINKNDKQQYSEGTIPKEYEIQILLDKGLPYTVKQTLVIKNNRGLPEIQAPRYSKKDQSILYDGRKYSQDDSMIDMKILNTIYFKEPFLFNQKLYYSDGEGVLRKVENRKFYVDIDYKIYDTSNTNDFTMKETLDKNSDLYKELNQKMKKQGIYLVVNKTSEDNNKSQKIIRIDFDEE